MDIRLQTRHIRYLSDLLLRCVDTGDLSNISTAELIKVTVDLVKKPGGHDPIIGSKPLVKRLIDEIESREDLETLDTLMLLESLASLMTKKTPEKSDKDKTLAELTVDEENGNQRKVWERRNSKK